MNLEDLSGILDGAGPYMGAAIFMGFVQLAVIGKIQVKEWRIPLTVASVLFQMLALGAGMFAQ